MNSDLIIGLGNLVLSDDALGPLVVRKAQKKLRTSTIDFKEIYSSGFDLLYEIIDYDRAILIDSIITGQHTPGTCLTYNIQDLVHLKTSTLVNAHGLNLPTICEIGTRCGYKIPHEFKILAVEVSDTSTFSENLTPQVEAAVDTIIQKIEKITFAWNNKLTLNAV